MAQPLLSPFRLGDHTAQSQWPIPPTPMSNNMMSTHTPLWEQHSTSTDRMTWSGLLNENQSVLANGDLRYNNDVLKSTSNMPFDFGRPSFWPSSDMSNMTPSPGADVLLSPVSPFSDMKAMYSPGPDYSPVTPSHGSASYMASPSATQVSSVPGFIPPTPQSVVRQQSANSAMQTRFGLPEVSLGPPYMGHAAEQDDMTSYASEQPYGHSQNRSPDLAPWLPPGYLTEKSVPTASSQHQHAGAPLYDRRPNSFLAPLNRSARQRQAQWSNTGDVPAQPHFQTRFMTPVADSEKAQRTRDDETLLQMKQDGYTYKDIRKALNRKVAESTLRGRYRSLTKPRKDRLRAPKWTDNDIVLLKRYVQEELDRLDVTQPSLESKQKPDKVPWMKVVDLIAKNGGTYRFGAATAKKKWLGIQQPSQASTCPSGNLGPLGRQTYPQRALDVPGFVQPTRAVFYLRPPGSTSWSSDTMFQLRFCPSLAKKPIPKLEAPTPIPKKHFDPFDNPSPDLHIVDIPTAAPTHLLVLNKFPIIAEHFILATKTNKQQTHILEQDDLEATYACLKAWGADSKQKRLFAFFNSGDHSGASQPHRHLQFLPVEHMRDNEATNGWGLLIDSILSGESGTGALSPLLQAANIPFEHFGRRFDAEPTGQELLRIYNELYGLARDAVDRFIAKNASAFALHPTEGGDSPISYNLAMTTEGMMIVPRRSEGTMLKRPDGSEIGFVALNGTTLGGTLLVKHQEEWDVLRMQRGKLDSILNAVGIPKVPQTYNSRV
ncbi:hypothetical protein OPT61_g4823 [Boeremia exigua]|uniref:Uncharacterized protein n=1 Tax=Boeremia exigua TaxID=749465 RepID=A0ACC2ICS8_9PLEO|nr:hypothetical protein OPT61_g4823 [Boeremia exigua]